MSKIILFSDLHGHPFKPYATLLPNGRNSRLNDAVNCIAQIREHAEAIGADMVLFGGDMFHVRKNIPVAAFNPIYDECAQFPMLRIPLVLIHGNHDQADRFGDEFSTYAFGAFATVIDKPGWIAVDTASKRERIGILGVPYTEDIDNLRYVSEQAAPSDVDHKIFLGHFGVQGAVVGADFVYKNPFDAQISDIGPDRFDAVYLGHYHMPQQLAPNAHYIGAPLQHNWGDRNQQRGFVIYDTETRTHEFVPLKAPQFVELTEQQLEEADLLGAPLGVDDSYVRIVSDNKYTAADIETLRKRLEARTLEVVKPRKKDDNVTPRLQVEPTMATNDVIETFLHSGIAPTDGLDENYLTQLANEIMQEVEETR